MFTNQILSIVIGHMSNVSQSNHEHSNWSHD